MNDWLWGLVTGVFPGIIIGHNLCWKRFVRTDALGEGIRSQMSRVRNHKRFVGEEYEVTSHATVTTIDGEFEVIVREATHRSGGQ